MSQLLARIMLVIFMVPCAGMLHLICYFVGHELLDTMFSYSRTRRYMLEVGTGAITWAFVAVYWWLVWRKVVRWTAGRKRLTLLAFAASLLVGSVFAAGLWWVDDDLALFIASVMAPLAWLIMTTLIWRDSARERADHVSGTSPVTCPTCGYNLTGLKGTRCPECGSEFTLDELLARQPGAAGAELT